jgi:hypothetical protein
VRDLQDRFPKADLIGAEPEFEKTVAQVVAFVEAPRIGLDLPLDVRGTAFQQRVWQALRGSRPAARWVTPNWRRNWACRKVPAHRACAATRGDRARVATARGCWGVAQSGGEWRFPNCHRVVRTLGRPRQPVFGAYPKVAWMWANEAEPRGELLLLAWRICFNRSFDMTSPNKWR